ncbi:MAG: hypothetical protein AAFY88_00455 [Acidobacteriota bacterium]
MRTFHWKDCREALLELDAESPLAPDAKGRFFEGGGLRVKPPLVFPLDPGYPSLAAYLRDLPDAPGRHCVILMQAGAVSLGRFEDGEALIKKSLRRYVVRGKGRAQPLHLKTKGKSRYGSRLRLANARKLLVETNEKLLEWEEQFGPADRTYYSCPVRLWPSLFETTPAPPFKKTDPLVRIPLDLPRPTVDVLQRTYRSFEYGRIEDAQTLSHDRAQALPAAR